MHKVSVIIPCYNSEDTIARTLESLRRQTFRDFEIIVADDGSTDRTVEIISGYGLENLRILRLEHKGVSAARNAGIRSSEGEYIAFLDSDDQYSPEMLEVLTGVMEQDADIAACRYRIIKENVVGDQSAEVRIISYDRRGIFDLITAHRKERVNFYCALYKSGIIKDNNVSFPEEFRYGEDTCFFLEYASHCINGGILVDSPMYLYYMRPASAMHTVSYDRIQNISAHRKGLGYWKNTGEVDTQESNLIIARAVWAVAKDFAVGDRRLFKRFITEHDIKKYMRLTAKGSDEKTVRISSKVYMISPILFGFLVKGYSFITRITEHIK